LTDTSHLRHLRGGPEGHSVYSLTVTYTSGYSDIGTCDTFEELSKSIDAAMASPGFVRYEVGPAGDR
jgi:hypothetical protein